ncbi:hypothetical protein ACTPEM_23465, partial [Clostridioides difficile]
EMTSRIYNYKYINEVKKYYHDNAVVHFICDKDLNGYDEIQGMPRANGDLWLKDNKPNINIYQSGLGFEMDKDSDFVVNAHKILE